jgi:hypothetical protein
MEVLDELKNTLCELVGMPGKDLSVLGLTDSKIGGLSNLDNISVRSRI